MALNPTAICQLDCEADVMQNVSPHDIQSYISQQFASVHTHQSQQDFKMSTSNIIYRKLGKDGPEVPALGYGAMGLSGFYGNRVSDEESHEIIKMVRAGGCRLPSSVPTIFQAVDEGCTFIDTSNVSPASLKRLQL
jgi:hypothetical protein